MDFFVYTEGKNKGQIGWECVKSIDAANTTIYDPNKNTDTVCKKAFEPNWKKEKAKFIWRICKNDILELHLTEQQIKEYDIPKGFVTQNKARNTVYW